VKPGSVTAKGHKVTQRYVVKFERLARHRNSRVGIMLRPIRSNRYRFLFPVSAKLCRSFGYLIPIRTGSGSDRGWLGLVEYAGHYPVATAPGSDKRDLSGLYCKRTTELFCTSDAGGIPLRSGAGVLTKMEPV